MSVDASFKNHSVPPPQGDKDPLQSRPPIPPKKGNGLFDDWLGKSLFGIIGVALTIFATAVVGVATFRWKAALKTAGVGLVTTAVAVIFAPK